MSPSRFRVLPYVYVLLLLLCGAGFARYDAYKLDGDAVAFMDIADAMRAHNLAHVVNGYWNPAYPAALAAGSVIAHPTRWTELQTFYWVNFFIFAGCIASCFFFVISLLRLRERSEIETETLPALSRPILMLGSLALLFASFQRELSLGAIRSDSLLLLFLLVAAGLLLRLQTGGPFVLYPLLGFTLGLAYLTKSFAFLPSGILIAAIFVYAVTRRGKDRTRIAAGAVVAGIVFAAVAGPYIAAISKQRGRWTTGESARINYAYAVDQVSRWHAWHTGEMGHGAADFKHHEDLLMETPQVYSFEKHEVGTYPLWFDPAYWTDTLQPRFYLRGHVQRLARSTSQLIRLLLGHLEAFVLFGMLALSGCLLPRSRANWRPMLPVMLWGLLMLAIYFPIDLQDRYLTASMLLVAIPLLALMRRPRVGCAGEVAAGAVITLALLMVTIAVTNTLEHRRILSVSGYPSGAYSMKVFPAAKALDDMGIGPGKPVACLGELACVYDHYWARLAGTPIRLEIATPPSTDAGSFWETLPDPQQVIDVMRSHHVAAIVALFMPSGHVPAGWQKLGAPDPRTLNEMMESEGEFYVYPIPAQAGPAKP